MRGIHGMAMARSILHLLSIQKPEPVSDGTKTRTHPHDYPRLESRQVRRARERAERKQPKEQS